MDFLSLIEQKDNLTYSLATVAVEVVASEFKCILATARFIVLLFLGESLIT